MGYVQKEDKTQKVFEVFGQEADRAARLFEYYCRTTEKGAEKEAEKNAESQI